MLMMTMDNQATSLLLSNRYWDRKDESENAQQAQSFLQTSGKAVYLYNFNRADMVVRRPREAMCNHFKQVLVYNMRDDQSEALNERKVFITNKSSKLRLGDNGEL